jgi:preprotein translocase subunit SecE
VIDKLKLVAAAVVIAIGVAAFYYLGEQSVLIRAGIVIVSVVAALAIALTSAPGQAAWEFSKAARTEVRKVVWPTRRETAQATGIVLLLVFLVGVYIFFVDKIMFWVIYDIILGTTA